MNFWIDAGSGLSIQTNGSVVRGWAGSSEGAGVSGARSRSPKPTGGRLLPPVGPADGEEGSVTPDPPGPPGAWPGTWLGPAPGLWRGWTGAAGAPQRPSAELHATSRNRSCACRSTVSTRSRRLLPGISTTTNSLPCVVTSASATPEPLTRWSMIPAASARFSSLGEPSETSVIRVPPCRSSPRVGVHEPAMATSAKMIPSPTKNPTSLRPGRRESRATGHTPGLVSVDPSVGSSR